MTNAVARRLVMPPHREGGQAQYIPYPVGEEDRPWLAQLLDWVQRRLHEDLPIERLAREARMSKRTLARRFRGDDRHESGRLGHRSTDRSRKGPAQNVEQFH